MTTSPAATNRWWFALGQRGHFHFEAEVCAFLDEDGDPLYQTHVLATLLSLHRGLCELLCERDKKTFRLFVRSSALVAFRPVVGPHPVLSPAEEDATAPAAPPPPPVSPVLNVISLRPPASQPKDDPT